MRRGPMGSLLAAGSTGGETVRAFIPRPLPPDPPLQIDAALREPLDAALVALGRLDSITVLLPDTNLFLYSYIRKEAVLSSQIEGTQSSLSDLLLFEEAELPGVSVDDVIEVSNYVAAMEHGLTQIRNGFPLSNRLIREIHSKLLARGRGAQLDPGEFRRTQNWIGGTRPGDAVFVPPPPYQVPDCMQALERWLNDGRGHVDGDPAHEGTESRQTPTLIKAALSHVQFETIHPFLDGNGRVGRLLITLLLCAEGMLTEPLLYLSLYLKERRAEYYSLLDLVRSDGDWEAWLRFFAEGVRATATSAVTTARRLVTLIADDRDRVQSMGRLSGTATRIHLALQQRPVASASTLARRTGVSMPAINNALVALIDNGMVREMTGQRRNRVFSYDAYLRILAEGTEPLAR